MTISLTVSNLVKASLWSSFRDLALAFDPFAVETETVPKFRCRKVESANIPIIYPSNYCPKMDF